MFKKNIILGALILTVCTAAAFTSCGNDMNGNAENANGERVTDTADKADKNEKETVVNNGNVIGGIEGGAENIGNDIKDSITNPEDATHGPEDNNAPTENIPMADPEANMAGDAARHRQPANRGK